MDAVWVKGLENEMNVQVTFVYSFVPGDDTVIEIAASNVYRLFFDGKLSGYGPARAAEGYVRLDKYRVPRDGDRPITVAVEVYSAQVSTFYIMKQPPFFACEITEGGRTVASTGDFRACMLSGRVQKVRRYAMQRSFTEVYRPVCDPHALYSGVTGPDGWLETVPVSMPEIIERRVSYPDLGEIPFKAAESGRLSVDGSDGCAIARYMDVEEYEGFDVRDFEDDHAEQAARLVFEKDELTEPARIGTMRYTAYDLGRSMTGFFKLRISAEPGTVLYILFDETAERTDGGLKLSPFRNNTVNVVKYVFPEGKSESVTFEPVTARYAFLAVTKGSLDIDGFSLVTYENPDPHAFRHSYADPELDEIVDAAVNTLSQNSVDILTDCPSRERAGWLCDSFFSSKAERLFTGDNRAEYSFLENYAMARSFPKIPDGMIPMCYPADSDGTYIPNWSMWYILELEDYLKRTGDRKMIDMSEDRVRGLISFYDRYLNEYGLLENLDSWVFIEWSMCNTDAYISGLNYPTNMLWADALRAAGTLYGIPGLSERCERIKETVRQMAWNGKFFEDNALRGEDGKLQMTGHTTETAQYYAFYFGIADRGTYPELWDLMLNTFGPSRDFMNVYPDVHFSNVLVGFYLRLELLSRYGYGEKLLEESKKLFLKMARETGTLWEHWRMGASLNHGFASAAAVYIDRFAERR